ncbi:MAG TPA: hypothetical protein VMD91_14440 [Candidatus Sulfotelmatobacter sp.]|nr:hypothetical protein [Candidatus Sulfotelmatobacter sp.]
MNKHKIELTSGRVVSVDQRSRDDVWALLNSPRTGSRWANLSTVGADEKISGSLLIVIDQVVSIEDA